MYMATRDRPAALEPTELELTQAKQQSLSLPATYQSPKRGSAADHPHETEYKEDASAAKQEDLINDDNHDAAVKASVHTCDAVAQKRGYC